MYTIDLTKNDLYIVYHNIDNELITVLESEEEFIDFARKIAKENGDDEEMNIPDAVGAFYYLVEYCSNLTILNKL